MKYLPTLLAVGTAATALTIAVTVVTLIKTDFVQKLLGLAAEVRACRIEIAAIAELDNPVIGAKIKGILEEHAVKSSSLVEFCVTMITLSTDGAKGLRERFVKILVDAKGAVTPFITELRPETRLTIANRFKAGLLKFKRLAGEIYNIFGLDINAFPAIEGALNMAPIQVTEQFQGRAEPNYESTCANDFFSQ